MQIGNYSEVVTEVMVVFATKLFDISLLFTQTETLNGLFSCWGGCDIDAPLLRLTCSKSPRVPDGAAAPVSYNLG